MILILATMALARDLFVVARQPQAGALPEGFTVSVVPHDSKLELVFANASPGTITIDWAGSVVIVGDDTDTLIPGEARGYNVSGAYQPAVLPPGTTKHQWLYRGSTCDGKGCKNFVERDEFSGFSIDFALIVNGEPHRARIPFGISIETGENICSVYFKPPCVAK